MGVDDLRSISTLYGLTWDAQERLKVLASEGRRRAMAGLPSVPDTDFVTMAQSSFLELEREATAIREFNSGVIPGLLQTEQYMHASVLGSSPDVSLSSVSRTVEIRRGRQDILLRKSPPSYSVILDESAIARRVGGTSVMITQIESLLSRSPDVVDVRVIPFSHGSHPGVISSFVALDLASQTLPGVVFTEGLVGHLRIDDVVEIDRYSRVWDSLLGAAVPSVDSRELLEGHLSTLRSCVDR